MEKLYKIGELAKLDLLEPDKRSDKNYRYYSNETIIQLKRIENMKKEKYTLIDPAW